MPAELRRGFSIKSRIKSFGYAINGLKHMFHTEHNARIHGVLAVLVFILCLILKPCTYELIAIVFCIALVFITELLNTAIEKLADYVEPEWSDAVGMVKDLAAAAVLLAAIASLIIGAIIFVPKLF